MNQRLDTSSSRHIHIPFPCARKDEARQIVFGGPACARERESRRPEQCNSRPRAYSLSRVYAHTVAAVAALPRNHYVCGVALARHFASYIDWPRVYRGEGLCVRAVCVPGEGWADVYSTRSAGKRSWVIKRRKEGKRECVCNGVGAMWRWEDDAGEKLRDKRNLMGYRN